VQRLQVFEELRAAAGRQRAEDSLHIGLVARRDFFPQRAAPSRQEQDDLPAVLRMFLALDQLVADHAVEHNGNARFAHQQQVDQCGLVHPALVHGEQVEDVELGAGQAMGLEEGVAAAFHQILHEEQGDEEIMRFGLAFHGDSITVNSTMSNYIALDDFFRVYPVRGWHGAFHLLHDRARRKAVLLDAGLVGEIPRLEKIMRGLGLGWPDIEAILLTHGHLDHTGNLARSIQGSQIALDLSPIGDIEGAVLHESQLRPLAKLPTKEMQREAFVMAVKGSATGQPTASQVNAAVHEMLLRERVRAAQVVNRKPIKLTDERDRVIHGDTADGHLLLGEPFGRGRSRGRRC
jgi:hypothetical protein